MSKWTHHEIPSFAVVGRVNMGKSAVLATLLEIDDDALIRVSPTPGETTQCQLHRIVFDDREQLRFIDTPGFSRPIEAMRAIQEIHGPGTPGLAALRSFVAAAGEDFGDEKRLLEPLIQGTGILYVVDPSRPLRDDFIAEMEILRWTGRPRLALLNRRNGQTGPDEENWLARLGASFNLVRSFDAHAARYPERLALLESLLVIEERHRLPLEQTIRSIHREWEQRREDAADTILDFFREALQLRTSATLEEADLSIPHRKQRKLELLSRQYFDALATAEQTCFKKLLTLYRHHLLQVDPRAESFRGIDLESAETWSKWGLRRGQLTLVSALAGGSTGLALDMLTGGISHGAGTVIGAIGGGAVGWFKGGDLPDLRLDLKGGVKFANGQGRSLSVGPPRNPNFPWVLLDGVLTRYSRMLARAHGRRDTQRLDAADEGFTRHFPSERRTALAKWFTSCLKGKPDPELEPMAVQALLECLREIADSPPPQG